jgi:hypothetical protein
MREFVSAGGELIIHGALRLKNSPAPKSTIQLINHLTKHGKKKRTD